MMKLLNVGDRVMNTWVYARSDDAVVMVDTGYAGRMARFLPHLAKVRLYALHE